MPVHHYGFQLRHDRDDLVEALASELRKEQAARPIAPKTPPNGDPEIYIDETGHGRVHICVIWNHWRNVPEVQRPAIILDAFDKAGRRGMEIAVAMGLTPDEAKVLGMDP